MATQKKQGGRPSGAAAARSETKDDAKPKTITVRGLKLELPDEIGSELVFAMADAEESSNVLIASLKLVRAIVGEEQYAAIRRKFRDDQVPLEKFEEEIEKVANAAVEAYGFNTAGE